VKNEKKFLLGLALWKVGAFLANKPSFDPRSRQTGPSLRLRTDCYLRSSTITWAGVTGIQSGEVQASQLLGALPSGFKKPADPAGAPDKQLDFATLVEEALSEKTEEAKREKPKSKRAATTEDKQARDAGAGTIYDGPLVTVVYEPKPKQKPGKGESIQAPPTPESEQVSEPQE
jgi:hypothetical protein